MNKYLVATAGVAYAAKTGGGTIADHKELGDLATGAIAVFSNDNELITGASAATVLDNKEGFYFAVGVSSNPNSITALGAGSAGLTYPRIYPIISKNAHLQLKSAYRAPVAKVIEVGGSVGSNLNFPTVLVAGTEYTFRVSRDTKEEFNTPSLGRGFAMSTAMDSIIVSDIVRVGDTQEIIVDRVVAAINAHPSNAYGSSSWVTAVKFGAGAPNFGIRLTSNYFNQDFSVSLDDLFLDSAVAVATELDYGHGHWKQISEAYQKAEIEEGDSKFESRAGEWYSVNNPVAQANYLTYSFAWLVENRNAINSNIPSEQTMSVAVVTGDALVAILDTMFPKLLSANEVITGGTAGNI